MLIRIQTESGDVVVVPQAVTVTYVRCCRYREDHDFQTEDSRQRFCCESHRVMFCVKNHIPADELLPHI